MKKFLLILVLLIPQTAFAQGENNLNLLFSSPDKSCVLRYKGASRGIASYYHLLENGEKLIYEGDFSYGPMVIWISNKVAELRIPSGSPNYNSYFYNCESNKLSPEYMLPVAADTANGVVATLDLETIIFYRLFTKTIIHKMHVPRLEPMGFLVSCEPNARFEPNGTFILEYKCPEQPIKKITIKEEILRHR
jgi:hypothetical protein